MNIYEITQEYAELIESVIEQEGEITPEQEELLAINEENFSYKADAYCRMIKNISAEAEALKAEKIRLAKRQQTAENAVERMKKTLADAMQLYGREKFESGTFKCSLRRSERVTVSDNVVFSQLPEEVVKVTYDVDKTKAKELIKAGEEIEGVTLESSYSLTIR